MGQNIKYDLHVFANHGIAVQGYRHDTLLQSYVLEAHKPHSLESLAERHLGRKGLSYEDLCGKGAHQIPFAQVDVDRAAEYSGEDSEMTLQVHRTLWPQIEADAKLRFVYEHIEMPTSRVLQRIERNGVLIDAQQLAQQSKDLGERMVALEQQAYALAGQPFNLGSPKQIGEILFGKLGLPVVKKTASGAPSTDEEVLEKLAEDHPLPQAHARAPQPGQAEGHLHRQAAADGQPAHRPRAHQLRAGGGRHRPAGQQRPEPAEHPHPHGRGPARARGLRRAAGPRDHVGRLLADRAAADGAHQRRRRHACAPSPPARTSTAPPRPRSSRCRWPRSGPSSGAMPRPSTSA